MPLPAEVLPQLLSSSALSGQPEAQRGLWNICEGTGAKIANSGEIVCEWELWQAWHVPWQRGKQHCAKWERGHGATSSSAMAWWRERNVTLSCVTFTAIMLVCLSGWSLCFGVRCHFSSHAFHCPIPHINPCWYGGWDDLLVPLLTHPLFAPPSGVRGTNSVRGFNCVTCWWRHYRSSHDTHCCCGISQRGARRRMRPKACRR